MGMAIFPLIGPALGGVLEVKFGWIASFWVLLGVGIFIFLLTYFDMGETNRHKTASMTEQFHAYPELLKSRRFWGYSLTAAFNAGGYYAYLGGAAYVGLEIFELSPDILGFYIGSPVLGYVIGNGLSGRYSVTFGINKMISMGSMITSMGMILCIGLFTMTVPIPLSFFGCVFLTAIGHGMVLPNANAGMMSVRPKLAGSASGLGGALNTGGGAIIATGTAAVLIPGTGALTLILIMLVSCVMTILTIAYVIKRTQILEREEA
jgi:DHA1 family bicyclomycin/chloramphenicol resistance-like MFS transporter